MLELENPLPGRPVAGARDLKNLAARFIPPELAAAAHLRRLTSVEGAEQTGRRNNADYGGIWIPYIWPGERRHTGGRLRRDKPDVEIKRGRRKETNKYLAAPGDRNKLYFPPGVTPEELADSTIPLLVTEGEFKALALEHMAAEIAWAAVPCALSGVANWRGRIGKTTDADGARVDEKGPIPDWDRIALDGRAVYIVFDADLSSNPQVRIERHRLAEFLTERKARPRFVTLDPAGPKGIDDVLAARGAAETWTAYFEPAKPADALAECTAIISQAAADASGAVLFDAINLFATLSANQIALAKEQIRRQCKQVSLRDFETSLRAERARIADERRGDTERKKEALRYRGREYDTTPDGLVYWRPMREGGHSPVYLCNFTAEIAADVTRDDGEETSRALQIRATLRNQATDIIVSAADFGAMVWPIEQLGAYANVYPGYKDHARSAIQALSDRIEQRYLYQHTGWTSIDGRPVYLHAGGGIGEHGAVPLAVELERPLDRYELPDPPEGETLRRAVRASLEMLGIAEDRITLPVFAAIWRAVLGPVHTSLFVAGQTGHGKSELAALAQQHFGAAMHAKALPAGWDSTANSLEALSYRAKNALFTVDDFVPRGGSVDVARMHLAADRLLRAQGNASGRGRLTADARMRQTRYPRGLIVGTGEDVPRGHSLRGRMVILELGAPLDWPLVSRCQKAAAAGQYAAAMAGFCRFVAPLMAGMKDRIQVAIESARETFAGETAHRRTPDNIAQLAAGFRLFLDFAVDAGAIGDEEAADLWDRAWRAYGAIVEEQDREQASDEPAGQFVALLLAALRSGAAHVSSPDKTPPEPRHNPKLWGWDGDAPAGPWIGWLDDDDLYLECQAAFAAVQRLSRDAGTPLLLTPATLGKRLKQRGLLASTDGRHQTNYVRRRFLGADLRVFHFRATGLLVHEKTRQNRQTRQSGAETPPLSGFVVGFSDPHPTNPTTKESTTYSTKTGQLSGLSGDVHREESDRAGNFPLSENASGGRRNPTTKPDNASEIEQEVAL